MTHLEVHADNKKNAERGLHFLEFSHGPGTPVVRHALQSILIRSEYALTGVVENNDNNMS